MFETVLIVEGVTSATDYSTAVQHSQTFETIVRKDSTAVLGPIRDRHANGLAGGMRPMMISVGEGSTRSHRLCYTNLHEG